MLRHVCALLLVFFVSAVAQPIPPDEIDDALSHAEALYYDKRNPGGCRKKPTSNCSWRLLISD